MKPEFPITDSAVSVYTVPTDAPEADGTFAWEHTTMVLVELSCGETRGLGYTYADKATAAEAQALLNEIVRGSDALRHTETWQKMLRHIRNMGETGIARMAVSAIDNALWTCGRALRGCRW